MTVIPPSSLPRFPQSVAITSLERPARKPLLSVFQATPTRKSLPAQRRVSGFLGVEMADNGSYLPSSPLQQRRSSIQLFNVVPDSAVKSTSFSHGIQETPTRQRTDAVISHSHLNAGQVENNEENVKVNVGTIATVSGTRRNNGTHEDSIYKSLGWDDGDDIDELA
jgi:DNA replication regulator SLD3